MGQKLEKIILLMWKNWLLQLRRSSQTMEDIFAPVLFCTLLVLLRLRFKPEEHEGITYPEFKASEANIFKLNNVTNQTYTLAYSPTNLHLHSIVTETVKSLGLNVTAIVPLPNSKKMEFFFQNEMVLANVLAGVQFDDSLAGNAQLPKKLRIALRFPAELRSMNFSMDTWPLNLLFPLQQMAGPRDYLIETTAYPYYYQEGFLGLQQALTLSIIKHFKNDFNAPDILMSRFPHPKWVEDPVLPVLQSFIGAIIMLSFTYSCMSTVIAITSEKEKQLKEAMKIMGLPNWLHWTAWFLKTFFCMLISVIIIVILFKSPWFTGFSLLILCNQYVLLLFFVLYICATITFSFAVTVFFSKANTATTFADILFILSYVPYYLLKDRYDTLSLPVKIISSLASNTAMAYGFQLIIMFEGTGEGLQWHNIFKTATPDDNLTFGIIMLMLIVDSIIYLLVALYVEAVMPGEYGIPRVWYFPFTSSFWCGQPKNTGIDNYQESSMVDNTLFEKEPANLKPGIQIIHLSKTFSNNNPAVRDLSLNIYNGQITVLLGHNGAGKTTTISMLTGIFPATGGTALVNVYDICTQMDKVRESLGLCPQHNILFDDLTVEDHLYFFSKLKGLNNKEVKSEIQKYIQLLELETKAKAKSSTLSGGMKRKLCVGIALCGNSKVVILDEPTSGMDPSGRRALWNLLKKQKEGRTILLTTHFMDEADVLGDRIAIMADGQVQCCGSSFFLKKKYGAGYHLVMDISSKCKPNDVTKLLRKHISDIQLKKRHGSELVYLLKKNQSKNFEPMLKDLEGNRSKLQINSYGISVTTLEEVFLKVGENHNQKETNTNNNNPNNHSTDSNVEIDDQRLLTGCKLRKNQCMAMLEKKVLSLLRSWLLFLIHILIPIIFLIISIVAVRNMDQNRDVIDFKFNLGAYDNPVTLLNGNDKNKYYKNYIKTLNASKYLYVDYGENNLAESILQLTEENTAMVRLRYIVASTFHSNNMITAWFNNAPYHSPPLALKLALDAVIETELGSEYSVDINNHPLPFTLTTNFKMLSQTDNLGFQLAFNIGTSMVFVSSFYILFYIKERVSKFKHLQFVSGVSACTFWLVSFICDFITLFVIALCLSITLVAFQIDGFKTAEEIGRILLLFVYFVFSILPLIYFFAYIVNIPSTGYAYLVLFGMYAGVISFMIIQIMSTYGSDLKNIVDILHWIFLLVPYYSLCTGIFYCYLIYSTYNACKTIVDKCEELPITLSIPFDKSVNCWQVACNLNSLCCDVHPNYITWKIPGILRNIVISFSVGIVLLILILLIEQNIFKNIIYKVINLFLSPPPAVEIEDTDVRKEKTKVQRMSQEEINEHSIVLKDVSKYYKKFLAVNNICLSVKPYECFGLLGVNGAGKTTTFKMMTGDVAISFGEAWVRGYSLKWNLKKVYQRIGYCPQFDALLDDLTGRETLHIFCLLRGVPLDDCSYVVEKLARDFDFHRHLNKKVKEYSGGNKRKLSTAIALIGDPPVIYLDEPTTGMDPATKRYLWNALGHVRENGKCIILTSHSTEECEALCTRLAIMVNGSFKCLGSTQHLKSKFSEGYTLTIKIKEIKDNNTHEIQIIDDFVKHNFPSAVLKETYGELLTYYISDKSMPCSQMFGIMEKRKKSLNIEDYSIGQSNLEQVFLSFTKFQREE